MDLMANAFANPPTVIVEMVVRFTVPALAMVTECVMEKLDPASVTVHTQGMLV
jgi:hypothetical protein